MQERQRFTAEFKREAVRLLQSGDRPAAVVARELGIPRNRLYKWAKDLDTKGAEAFAGSGRRPTAADDPAALKREIARLKEENEILKKRRRTSRGNCREVRLDTGAARLPGAAAVCHPGCLAQRLLRLAAATAEPARAG